MTLDLKITQGDMTFTPLLCGEIIHESFRRGRCSILNFTYIGESFSSVREGGNGVSPGE